MSGTRSIAPDNVVPVPELNWRRQPVGLDEPIDPVSGLPLSMVNQPFSGASATSAAITTSPSRHPVVEEVAPPRPGFIAPPSPILNTPHPDLRLPSREELPPYPGPDWQPPAPNDYPQNPGLQAIPPPSTLHIPDNPVAPPPATTPAADPLGSASTGISPVLFEGRIEPIAAAESSDSFPRFDLPIPKIDPPLPEMGNDDGVFDFYDLIEEYGGRATRSDIPDRPHMAHPEDRSWLRIEGWRAEASWLAGQGDDLGIASANGSVTFGLPKIKGVTVRPGVAAYWFVGPHMTDLPSRLYDGEVEGVWMHRFNHRFRAHTSVTVGLYSDLASGSEVEDSLRISGTGIGAIEVHPDVQLVMGAAYYNLGSVWIWPVAGVVWQPTDRWRFDLIFPEGRLSYVTMHNEVFTERCFVGAQFFGRTWQVMRTTGMTDKVTYQDWRVVAGLERYYLWGVTTFLQAGYTFGRKLEYRTGIGDFDPDSVAMVQAGFYF